MMGRRTEEEYEEFRDKMYARYPSMYVGYRFWGFEVGPGWWPLIENLSELITRHQKSIDYPEVVVLQVKEKFGGMRFYYNGGDRFVDGAVAGMESMSYRICEVCGAPGIPRTEGWIKTLCDVHHNERMRSRQAPSPNPEDTSSSKPDTI